MTDSNKNQNAIAQAMIRQIVAHTRCSSCGHRFAIRDVRVVGRRDKAWAMSAVCRECRSQALFLAMLGEHSVRPVYTDLYPEEWERLKARPPISADDVIEFFSYMDAYDGDLSEIMEDPLPIE